MTLDQYLSLGETIPLGTHTFDVGSIKEFAAKWDPQPFHLDEELARHSVFGALCASGWHTASVWMKLNLAQQDKATAQAWDGPGPRPEFGPSPGFQNLRWPKPVFAGETVSYSRKVTAHRRMASRPGWRIVTTLAEAYDSTGDKVLEFESAVLLRA
ncbi:MaoC family dehydratase [Mesorhizobium sp. RP14(2022)]|uniref:MaoC family dehydratase n=1 Tax=Mesorhizobium liriopis TaxID=2953882 RepID=A0ABT1C5T2_9HYPH|nr:MaoC family dehydratase [Mesorhizobium liriopis]MCO6049853.1 MaoC family dehydratase [Mesorhizobium liriopis]